MIRTDKRARLDALEQRAPKSLGVVHPQAGEAYALLIDRYRRKRPDLVAALKAAEKQRDGTEERRKDFAVKVVDLLMAATPEHRSEFMRCWRVYEPGDPRLLRNPLDES